MTDHLKNIISANKQGMRSGIYSICSANKFALKAAFLQAKRDGSPLLIEATSNQVDQFGGYTGMVPHDFAAMVKKIAHDLDFPADRLILGGDHLGPNVWQNEPAEKAMDKARGQIAAYVKAGFTKIHLDASMRLGGDPGAEHSPISVEIIARRAAELCKIAEESWATLPSGSTKINYVIGTDVPTPGGVVGEEEILRPTPVNEVIETVESNLSHFKKLNLDKAWERVVGVVVQPGVEFGTDIVYPYDSNVARDLVNYINSNPGLIYEAHSTDYQNEAALSGMVMDHFAILKVGPGLTFALREGLMALSKIETDLFSGNPDIRSNLMNVLEVAMTGKPSYWEGHYSGSEHDQRLARTYSYSDRIRYYWPVPEVQSAVEVLLANLSTANIPETLVSQHMPNQYFALREGLIDNAPESLVLHKVMEVTGLYANSCGVTSDVQAKE